MAVTAFAGMFRTKGFVLVGFTLFSTLGWAGAPAPCSTPGHRQFDFWLGSWEVTTPDGKTAGTNVITSELNGCTLHEHWVGAKGLKGESFNFYNGSTQRWHQSWVDDGGNTLLLDGAFVEGKMVLTDAKSENRISWSVVATDRVRQLWETSKDGGKTWSVAFDGTYLKRANQSGDGARVRHLVNSMPW